MDQKQKIWIDTLMIRKNKIHSKKWTRKVVHFTQYIYI